MKISIASDHGGFELKEKVVEHLIQKDYQVFDRGCPSIESVDYPDYAKFVCEDMQRNVCDYGILICTTGIGMTIYANKFHGIRAALVTNLDQAHLTRQHNNSNILCLAAKYTKPTEAFKYIEAYISETFIGGRHQRRIDKISEKDKEL